MTIARHLVYYDLLFMKEKTNNLPKISVVTITYGHQDYILDTIKGVLMQDYNGPIEFIIANDNSPDQTDTIVKQFFKENILPPNIEIRYTKHAINKGMTSNFIWALQQVTGDYIALCEGDDYWIDTLKLQKQVSFLLANQNYVAVGNQRYILNKDILSKAMFSDNIFYTQCVVFRNVLNEIYYKYCLTVFNCDTLMVFFLQNYGEMVNLEDYFSVYRIHTAGVYSGIDEFQRIANQLASYKMIFEMQKEIGNDQSVKYISKQIANNYLVQLYHKKRFSLFIDFYKDFYHYQIYKLRGSSFFLLKSVKYLLF